MGEAKWSFLPNLGPPPSPSPPKSKHACFWKHVLWCPGALWVPGMWVLEALGHIGDVLISTVSMGHTHKKRLIIISLCWVKQEVQAAFDLPLFGGKYWVLDQVIWREKQNKPHSMDLIMILLPNNFSINLILSSLWSGNWHHCVCVHTILYYMKSFTTYSKFGLGLERWIQ